MLLGLGVNLFHVQGFCLRDQVLKSSGRKSAGVTEDQDTFAEDHQSRDRCDLQCCRDVLVGIGIDLAENDVGVLLRDGLEDGAELTARAAPGCPEVNQDDLVGINSCWGACPASCPAQRYAPATYSPILSELADSHDVRR